MNTIQLKPIKTWTEKSDDDDSLEPEGFLRIYAGSFLCGTAIPDRIEPDLYRFDNDWSGLLNVPSKLKMPIDEIIGHIELSLKEFIVKVAK